MWNIPPIVASSSCLGAAMASARSQGATGKFWAVFMRFLGPLGWWGAGFMADSLRFLRRKGLLNMNRRKNDYMQTTISKSCLGNLYRSLL